jgi:hypothetical protein
MNCCILERLYIEARSLASRKKTMPTKSFGNELQCPSMNNGVT